MGSRKSIFHKKEKEEDEDNPFTKPSANVKGEDATTFIHYAKGVLHSFGQKVSSDIGFFGRRKIHIRFLRQTKRVVATGLMFLYFALALVSFPNPMFFLFLFTSYLMLDYLWKSRRIGWKKIKSLTTRRGE